MTEEQLTHLRSIMISRIEAIWASLAEDDLESKPIAPDVAFERSSRLEPMQSQQMNLAQQRCQREEKERLKNALDRIDKGSCGTCAYCLSPISYDQAIEMNSDMMKPEAMEEVRIGADEQIFDILDNIQSEVFETLREISSFGNFTICAC